MTHNRLRLANWTHILTLVSYNDCINTNQQAWFIAFGLITDYVRTARGSTHLISVTDSLKISV